MKLIELPDGNPAWICDTLERAIYPERYQMQQPSIENYAGYEEWSSWLS
jgi:hypothetical protein